MNGENQSKLRIGGWGVDPVSGNIERNGKTTRLDRRAMRLLLCLAERAGQVVSIDDLICRVWEGVAVSPDSVYQAVTSLRRRLGDDPRNPAYIETVPRLGYRMIASVRPWADQSGAVNATPEAGMDRAPAPSIASHRKRAAVLALVAVAAAVIFGFVLHAKIAGTDRHATSAAAATPQPSIGVLPFLDLTEGMRDEEFADGVTEELIDKLSKIPGFSVPSATASFYYKGNAMPVGAIAKGLNVVYLLDGSVRKSGGRVRIVARLMRAENSYVIWTNTYDRPVSDLIMVQDDIAGEVAKALQSTIAPSPELARPH
jgi:transcriptional activator of cad operon